MFAEPPVVIESGIEIEKVVGGSGNIGLVDIGFTLPEQFKRIAVCNDIVAARYNTVEIRCQGTGVGRVGPGIEIHKGCNGETLGDEIQFLVKIEGYIQLAFIDFLERVEHICIGIGVITAGTDIIGTELDETAAVIRENGRIEHGVVVVHLLEDIVGGRVRGLEVGNLGIHPQAQSRGRGHLVLEVVLEDVPHLIVVVVQGVVLRDIQHAAVVIELEAHIVGHV